MAEFECKVYKLEILPHPNADAIELAKVGDYLSIVKKDVFKTGDLGVYIPEAAICPNWLIIELGLEGKLAGKDENRVKAIKLRGILSQGLIYPMSYDTSYQSDSVVPVIFNDKGERWEANEGDIVNDFLGITKWEPPIPVHMAGEVWNAHGYTLKYDIENFKRFVKTFHKNEVFELEVFCDAHGNPILPKGTELIEVLNISN
jgi:RNA ligase (TIGR02306 family)